MTPAEHDLITATCARAAELWSLGHDQPAARWFNAAVALIDEAGDFIDTDDEQATR